MSPLRSIAVTAAALATVAASAPSIPASAVAPATPAVSHVSSCRVSWGSLAKVWGINTRMTTQHVTTVRTGRHACYDRMVVDIAKPGSGRAGYSVRYVKAVRGLGSGDVIPVKGGARLEVLVNAPSNSSTSTKPINVTGYSTFRQIKRGGSFEGQTLYAVGVRARLPMRAFLLTTDNGQKLVIDVAHHW